MSKILPVLIVLAGLLGGFGAGLALRPDPEPTLGDEASDAAEALSAAMTVPDAARSAAFDIVRISDQFAVPVLSDGHVGAIVVLSVSLEMTGTVDGLAPAHEARLRDRFLQVLFDHANSGGFAGNFTLSTNMTALRTALFEAARAVLGDTVGGVLITDIYRRDI